MNLIFTLVWKKGGALSSLLFSFAFEYVFRKVLESYDWLELNGTLQLSYANLVDESMYQEKGERGSSAIRY
jgi:hypothetical protein